MNGPIDLPPHEVQQWSCCPLRCHPVKHAALLPREIPQTQGAHLAISVIFLFSQAFSEMWVLSGAGFWVDAGRANVFPDGKYLFLRYK